MVYRVKGQIKTFVTVIKEDRLGYEVLITREKEDFIEERRERMNKDLFNSCLRTGFMEKVSREAEKAAS